MKRKMVLIAIASTLLLNCTKEEENTGSTSQNSNNQNKKIIPLKVGNYWLYNTYKIDTLGNETLISQSPDSLYVSKDTLISGKAYYIVKGSPLSTGVLPSGMSLSSPSIELKNENNSLFDIDGNVLFTLNNIGTVYYTDTITGPPEVDLFEISSWINSQKQSISVDAGTFLCYDKETKIFPLNSNINLFGTRYTHTYHNSDIGIVLGQYLFGSSPDLYEIRLVAYHIN